MNDHRYDRYDRYDEYDQYEPYELYDGYDAYDPYNDVYDDNYVDVGRHGRRPPRRRLRYAALGTGAGVAALAGGVIVMLPHQLGNPLANHCFVSCKPAAAVVGVSGDPVPSPDMSAGAGSTRAKKPHPKPTHSKTPKPKPSKSSTPQPTSSSGTFTPSRPDVSIAYDDTPHLLGGFDGEFTITNEGSTTVSGWSLVASFPGDNFSSASGANASASGSTITFTSPPNISPGSTLRVSFQASGGSTHPASCTINGFSC